jgi:ribose-phosphate pyrophosphokinase
MEANEITLFALSDSQSFGELEERDFADGEHKIRPLVNVRGRDVFVIQSLYSDMHRSVNDKLCRLLFFLNCLRDKAGQAIR